MSDISDLEKKIMQDKALFKFYTMEELVLPWVDNEIYVSENPLFLGYETIDKELRGNLRGKVCVTIGKGGSKKSLGVLNAANHNSIKMGEKMICLYSSMEMPAIEVFGRALNYSMDHEDEQGFNQATKVLPNRIKEGVVKKEDVVKDLQKLMKEYYGNSLIISEKSGMTSAMYRKFIQIIKKKHGDCHMLIIDGLSMMNGEGRDRTRIVDDISREIKEIALEENVFINVIVHATKAATKTQRDLTGYARDSEKIIDNADFSMSYSQILVDGMEDEYRDDIGYIYFHDKRGTGAVRKIVYEFDKRTLRMTESETHKASDYEVKKKKGRFDY